MADVGEDLRGADVVVLGADGDLADIGRSAPAATIVITGDALEERCKQAYEQLLYPRARVFGIPDTSRVSDVVESIVFERDDTHEVVAMKSGEYVACSATLGRSGISELL